MALQLMFGGTTTQSATGAGLATGLVSYWKLNEASGSRLDQKAANNLTVNGTLTTVAGVQSNAVDSAAAAGYLSCAHNASQNFSAAAGITIAGWMKIHSVAPNPYPTILSKWVSGTSKSYFLFYNNDITRWQWYLSTNAADTNLDLVHTPTLNAWYFICARWNGTTMSLRRDSGADVTTAFAGPIFAGTVALNLLAFSDVARSDASLDEVGLWNRALTNTEVTYLYNGGSGQTYPFP